MNEHEAQRIAASIHELRPDWPASSLLTLIKKNLLAKPRRDVSVAFAWVACESGTSTPARVLEAGPWWRAAAADDTSTHHHAGRTYSTSEGDPRTICGICQMHADTCRSRAATNGHTFVARTDCLPALEVGVKFHGQPTPCGAGPIDGPTCRLTNGHDGPHAVDNRTQNGATA